MIHQVTISIKLILQLSHFDHIGDVYIGDNGNYCVRKVTVSTGIISTIAGTGTYGFSGDGGPATSARMNGPAGLVFDVSGNLYIADISSHILMIEASTGIISTIAGANKAPNQVGSYSGDGGPATSAGLNYPTDVALDAEGIQRS